LFLVLAVSLCFGLAAQPMETLAASAGKASADKDAPSARIKTSESVKYTGKSREIGKQKTTRASRRQSRRIAAKSVASASRSTPYKSCVIYNAKTRKTLFSRNPDRKIPPASLTKILAMYVAEDAIRAKKLNRNALVTISRKAASASGSRMGLRAGDKVSLDDLLCGMAVASGNDASIAVAEFIGGSERTFVRLMNKKARALGMSRSTFKNVNGLPAPGQYTTARDMLTLARRYLADYPQNLAKYHRKSTLIYKAKYSANANPLLGMFEGADGLKTGYVNASGYNLIATAKRDNRRYIGVILGAPSSAVRAVQSRALMEACFTNPEVFTADKRPKKLKKSAAPKQTDAALRHWSGSSGSEKASVRGKSWGTTSHGSDSALPNQAGRPRAAQDVSSALQRSMFKGNML
jgi:D-alanyl-D-alanine carboxypeptidase (penicillin-binding protein 5/6)